MRKFLWFCLHREWEITSTTYFKNGICFIPLSEIGLIKMHGQTHIVSRCKDCKRLKEKILLGKKESQ